MIDDDDEGETLGHATVKRVTGKALLCVVDGLGDQWVPVSVIHVKSEVYGHNPDNHAGNLVVQSWWARKNGLV